MIIGIIFLAVYVVIGLTAYKELYSACRNPTDEELVKKFKRKLVTHWVEYAYNIGRIRKAVRDNGEDDIELTATTFSKLFNEADKRPAKLYAELILNL